VLLGCLGALLALALASCSAGGAAGGGGNSNVNDNSPDAGNANANDNAAANDNSGDGNDNAGGGSVGSTEVLADTVEITVDGDGQATLRGAGLPAQIRPGALLVSTRDGGYLLRARAVAVNGDTVTVQTEQASLADVLPNGDLNLTIPFNPDQVRIEQPDGLSPELFKRMRFTKVDDRRARLTTTDHSLELEEYGKITLDELSIDFSPDFDVALRTEGGTLTYFLCQATTTFELTLDLTVEATAITDRFSKDTTIWKLSWPNPFGVMTIGGVPVVYQCYVDIKLGAQVTFGDLGTNSAGFDFVTEATLGAEYDRTGWHTITDLDKTLTPHPPEWGITPITAQVFVKPEFGIKFYQIVGPSLSWKEYVELAGAYRYDRIGAEIARGSVCDLNINFKIIDGLPSFKYTKNLFTSRQVLLARMLYDVDPVGLGTVSVSPDDLAWGMYLFTDELTLTAEPQPGYEAVGWTVRNLLDGGSQVKTGGVLRDEPVNASRLYTAGFVPEGAGATWSGAGSGSGAPIYTITTEVFPPEAGQIIRFPGGDAYQYGINVLVAAQAASGFEFHHWEGSLGGENPTQSLEMSGNPSVRAVFASNPPRTLRVPADYGTLQQALAAATYNDVIEIAAGTYSGDGFCDLAVARDHITIRGAGPDATIIDLADAAQLAWLDDVNVAFEDVQIYRGSGNLGGALRVTGVTNVSFSNCKFRACHARDGGAIYASGTGTKVHWEDCVFDSNRATSSGGAVSLGIRSNNAADVPVLSNCSFTGNVADSSGGGIAAGNPCRLTNCTFTGNQAWTGGGGSFESQVEVTDCVFQGNSAQHGGGLYAAQFCAITGCAFADNVAERDGGGIKAIDGVSMQNCTLEGNQAGEDGGGIHANRVEAGRTLSVFGCVLTANTAGTDGGGIYCDGTEVAETEVVSNTAGQRGGGIRASYSQISGCQLRSNQAGTDGRASTSEGGGIYLEQSVVSNCQVTGNEAISGNGGGLHAQGSHSDTATPPVIFGVYAADNVAANGAGIFSDLEVHILSSTFEGNAAADKGGGISAARGGLVSQCQVRNNSAQTGGGVSVSDGAILASSLVSNQASRYAGGLQLFESSAADCIISNNTAASEGGGVWTGVGCSITDCRVTGNTVTAASGTGAGIACHGAPVLQGLTVSQNTPDNCSRDCTGCP